MDFFTRPTSHQESVSSRCRDVGQMTYVDHVYIYFCGCQSSDVHDFLPSTSVLDDRHAFEWGYGWDSAPETQGFEEMVGK